MNPILLFAVAAMFLASVVQATEPIAPSPSSSPVAECLRLASERGLSGAARDQFLRECVPARLKPGVPNPIAEPADPPVHC